MKFLADWFGPVWSSMPIAKTAAGFVQDFHHSPEILLFKPAHVAICCISVALQIYGVQVPVRGDQDPEQWYVAFVGDDLSKEQHWTICGKILAVYDNDDERFDYRQPSGGASSYAAAGNNTTNPQMAD